MKIKAYLYSALGLLVAGLLFAVKILAGRNSRLTRKVEEGKARVEHIKKVAQGQKDNEIVYRSRTAELARDLEERKASSELEDPNTKW